MLDFVARFLPFTASRRKLRLPRRQIARKAVLSANIAVFAKITKVAPICSPLPYAQDVKPTAITPPRKQTVQPHHGFSFDSNDCSHRSLPSDESVLSSSSDMSVDCCDAVEVNPNDSCSNNQPNNAYQEDPHHFLVQILDSNFEKMLIWWNNITTVDDIKQAIKSLSGRRCLDQHLFYSHQEMSSPHTPVHKYGCISGYLLYLTTATSAYYATFLWHIHNVIANPQDAAKLPKHCCRLNPSDVCWICGDNVAPTYYDVALSTTDDDTNAQDNNSSDESSVGSPDCRNQPDIPLIVENDEDPQEQQENNETSNDNAVSNPDHDQTMRSLPVSSRCTKTCNWLDPMRILCRARRNSSPLRPRPYSMIELLPY